MEMTLRLPSNYVEIEEEEMMHLDGGYGYTGIAIGTGIVAGGISMVLGFAIGKYIAGTTLASKIAGWVGMSLDWAKGALKAVGIIGGLTILSDIGNGIANTFDKNRNGWIGLYINTNGGYTFE